MLGARSFAGAAASGEAEEPAREEGAAPWEGGGICGGAALRARALMGEDPVGDEGSGRSASSPRPLASGRSAAGVVGSGRELPSAGEGPLGVQGEAADARDAHAGVRPASRGELGDAESGAPVW